MILFLKKRSTSQCEGCSPQPLRPLDRKGLPPWRTSNSTLNRSYVCFRQRRKRVHDNVSRTSCSALTYRSSSKQATVSRTYTQFFQPRQDRAGKQGIYHLPRAYSSSKITPHGHPIQLRKHLAVGHLQNVTNSTER